MFPGDISFKIASRKLKGAWMHPIGWRWICGCRMWALNQLFQHPGGCGGGGQDRWGSGTGSLRVLARWSTVPWRVWSCSAAGRVPPQPFIRGRSLGPEASDWPYPGRSPSPPLDRGERSAASRSAGSTMAGLWVGTVAQAAARRHWRRPPQQLLWTLKVSSAGLAWACLAVPGSQATSAAHPGCPRPDTGAGCAHTPSWHEHSWENARARGHWHNWAELFLSCSGRGWPPD